MNAMSSESNTPRTLVYARHIGRELALLSLSSLTQYYDQESLEELKLADILERATRMLTSEAEAYLKSSGKAVEESASLLDNLDTTDLEELSSKDLAKARRDLKKTVTQLREQLQAQTEEIGNAVNLIGEALHVPLLRTLSDNPHVRTFTLALVESFRDGQETLDGLINQVSKEWPLDRMNSIDRDMIRIAATEMLFDPMSRDGDATPLPVIINEAVELAKKYGTPDSYRFVNAVLRNLIPHAEERRRRG